MRISNHEAGGDSGWDDLVRLQSEYQARLTEETLRYLRGVQAAFSPRAPGTVVQTAGVQVRVSGLPGSRVDVKFSVENRQRVHTTVVPAISLMINDEGWTWYPRAEPSPAALVLAPQDVVTVSMSVELPAELPPGVFRGSIILQGFLPDPMPLQITVGAAAEQAPEGDR
ncbi:hypothetical protein [Actinoplanes sp. GCM10030250]|uniref:hypothetical protein n=1 Tax=Actinoplanes sp. GCM10030250 TaxID=3273376 RepID=UPI00361ABB6C